MRKPIYHVLLNRFIHRSNSFVDSINPGEKCDDFPPLVRENKIIYATVAKLVRVIDRCLPMFSLLR